MGVKEDESAIIGGNVSLVSANTAGGKVAFKSSGSGCIGSYGLGTYTVRIVHSLS